MKLNRQDGFSLVNVMIATALIALMSMGLAGLLNNMSRETKSLGNKMNKINLAQDLRVILADSKTCTDTLGGQAYNRDPKGETPLVAQLPNSKIQVKDGVTLPEYGLQIKRFYASNPVSAGASVNGTPLYVGELMLEAQEMALAPGEPGRQFKSSHAGMTYFELDPTGAKIQKCYALESGDDLLALACAKFNGLYNPTTRECDTLSKQLSTICTSMGGTYNEGARSCVLKTPSGAESCKALGGQMGEAGCQLPPPEPKTCRGPVYYAGRNKMPGMADKDYPSGSVLPSEAGGGMWSINDSDITMACDRVCVNGVWALHSCSTSSQMRVSCFTMGTRVTRADGSLINIEDLRPGDEVASASGRPNRVVRLERVRMGGRRLYSLNGEKAFVTAEHPFWTPQGWKSIDPVATAYENPKVAIVGALKAGDQVRRDGAWVKIESLGSFTEDENTVVYNPVLTGDHTYFADGYLVHNKH
ncbi:MAG: hypothetical protein KF802_03440 [Bdellovibrionaceae bacterium]|nr:hypothetical protein [Pseudobdellovibrionaceae bacterium]